MRAVLALLAATTSALTADTASVTETGLWLDPSGQPVSAFGINYAPMFAHSHRRILEMGLDPKKVIDQDVYHFVRMGLNAYRIHVWDIEISDAEGNLIENDHLDSLDYLIARLRKQGIDILLTPMFLGPNGYPDAPTDEPGFAAGHHKKEFIPDRAYAAAQLVYLRQLLEHVNPYTGTAYKDEPAIIGIEPVNEPWHEGGKDTIAAHLKNFVEVIRMTGCRIPAFYCMSQNPYLRDVYMQSGYDGFTFQWYPAGLSSTPKTLNLLPQVNSYPLFFGDEPGFRTSAKAFYELSLASVPSAYAYPPLAETIRKQGFQFAAYFCYDPMAIAAFNSEYPTHFMNLAYTPRHAINLMIAAEVFRGSNAWTVDAESDQSLLNTGELYYYSNGTDVHPASTDSLRRIAGFGSSPLVRYPGQGAYFLDKLAEGVWRLEVMPDARLLVDNPYWYRKDGSPVADVAWKDHSITVKLPDLGDNFAVTALDTENGSSTIAEDGSFVIRPGVYLLTKENTSANWDRSMPFQGHTLGHFVAPRPILPEPPAISHSFNRPLPVSDSPVLFDSQLPHDQQILIRSQNANRLIERQDSKNGYFEAIAGKGRLLWGHDRIQWAVLLQHRLPARDFTQLCLEASSATGAPHPVQFSFQTADGTVFAKTIELPAKMKQIRIPLAQFVPVPTGRIESNPSFLPSGTGFTGPSATLRIEDIRLFQFRLGPGLTEDQKKEAVGLRLRRAWLN